MNYSLAIFITSKFNLEREIDTPFKKSLVLSNNPRNPLTNKQVFRYFREVG